jgi:periplasmic copper chaperone A
MTKLGILAAGALSLLAAGAVSAHEYKMGDLLIGHPWARPTAEGAKLGAAYLSIENKGKDADKLVSAESPAAEKAELHESREVNGVMTMRAVTGGIEIKPGALVELKPGGYHIMLISLRRQLREGDTIPLTLTLAKAGPVSVEIKVEKTGGASAQATPAHNHDMSHMDHKGN